MQTIDEISIGRDGEMFTLTIYHYGIPDDLTPDESWRPNSSTTFLIGLPDQLHAEVGRTIGAWLSEAETTHAERVIANRPVSDWPYQPDALTHDAQDDTNPDLARDIERGK